MGIQPTEKNDQKTVHLLWTGGWDSTFRLLYLVFHLKKNVRPHYIVDTGRNITLREIETIANIKQAIYEKDPSAAGLVKPLMLTSLHEIPEDRVIMEKFSNLSSKVHFGIQYEWLARYAKNNPSMKLEIGLQHDNFANRFEQFFRGRMQLNSKDPDYQFWELVDVAPEEDVSILTPFHFPIWRTHKLQMKAIAEEHDFLDILEMSWFCHSPVKGKPCGLCTPCVVALREEMYYRFPRSAIRRNKWHFNPLVQGTKRVFRSIPRIIKKYTKLLFKSVTGKAFLF